MGRVTMEREKMALSNLSLQILSCRVTWEWACRAVCMGHTLCSSSGVSDVLKHDCCCLKLQRLPVSPSEQGQCFAQLTKGFPTLLAAWHLVLSVAMQGSAHTSAWSGWMRMLISTPLLQLSLETSMDNLFHFS